MGVIELAILTIVGFAMTLLYSAFADSVAFFDSFAFEYSAALPFLCLPLAAIALVLIVVSEPARSQREALTCEQPQSSRPGSKSSATPTSTRCFATGRFRKTQRRSQPPRSG